MHGLLYVTTPYDATDVPQSGADTRADGRHEERSHTIDFTQFLEKCVDYKSLRYRWEIDDDCANVRDGLSGLDVAPSRVDV